MDTMSTETLTLNLTGFEPLGTGYLYEGWVIVNGMPVSTGTFSVAEDGSLSQNQFELDADELMNVPHTRPQPGPVTLPSVCARAADKR